MAGFARLGAALCACRLAMGPALAAESAAPAAGAPLSGLPLQHDLDPGWSGIGLLQLLILALFLLVWLGWLWRRQGPGALRKWRQGGWQSLIARAEPGGLRVVQSAQLTPRASLHVVRWDGQEWLIGCTEGGVTELGRRARPEPTDPGTAS